MNPRGSTGRGQEFSDLCVGPVYDNDFMNSRWVKYMPEGHVAMRNVMFAPLNIEGKTVGHHGAGQ